jgi:hypothetical protein
VKLHRMRPVEARQLDPDNVRAVAEWLSPENPGYRWYEGSPALLRTPGGEAEVPMASWIMRIASSIVVLTPDEFDSLFDVIG